MPTATKTARSNINLTRLYSCKHLLYRFSITTPPPCQFLRDKILFKRKKKLGEMLIEQIIEFDLRGLGALSNTRTPKTDYFYDKTTIC